VLILRQICTPCASRRPKITIKGLLTTTRTKKDDEVALRSSPG
jgi:hypothetical protein